MPQGNIDVYEGIKKLYEKNPLVISKAFWWEGGMIVTECWSFKRINGKGPVRECRIFFLKKAIVVPSELWT